MIPLGYMAKPTRPPRGWSESGRGTEIYSVSSCLSKSFGDWVGCWKHNGFWFFNDPRDIKEVAQERCCFLEGTTLFYYEAHEFEWNEQARCWTSFAPDEGPTTDVVGPRRRVLEGYDVVCFENQGGPGCSPLSCNGLAGMIPTNPRHLLDDFEDARRRLEAGEFDRTEPGPFRIVAVYSTPWP